MIGLMEFSFTTNDYVTVPKSRKVPASPMDITVAVHLNT